MYTTVRYKSGGDRMGEQTTIRASVENAAWLRSEARRISATTDSDYSVDDVLTYVIAAYMRETPQAAPTKTEALP
jgi:hypothetical protein